MRSKLAKILIGVGGSLIFIGLILQMLKPLQYGLVNPYTIIIALAWLLVTVGLIGDLRATKPIVSAGALLFIVNATIGIIGAFTIANSPLYRMLGSSAPIYYTFGSFAPSMAIGVGLLLLSRGYRDITPVKILIGLAGALFACSAVYLLVVFPPIPYAAISLTDLTHLTPGILLRIGRILAGIGLVLFGMSLDETKLPNRRERFAGGENG